MVIKIVLVVTKRVTVGIFKYLNGLTRGVEENLQGLLRSARWLLFAVLMHQVGYCNFVWVYHRSMPLLKGDKVLSA